MSGFMYFVFILIQTCIGNYEEFMKGQDLISRFYSTDDCVNNDKIDKENTFHKQISLNEKEEKE
jgi:hypothetical protein